MAGAAPTLQLVSKAVDVLDLLAAHGELTVAQLAAAMGEPRSSLYRLVDALEERRMVARVPARGTIALGTHILYLGGAMQNSLDVRAQSLPVMQELRDEFGHTVFLVVRRGDVGVCIERLEGFPIATFELVVGGSLPLHAGAAPRALLAFGDEDDWPAYAALTDWTRYTERTVSDAAQLDAVLRAERARGWTLSDEDVTPGIVAVGAPVRDHSGRVIAALSVSNLRDAVVADGEPAEGLDRLARRVVTAADRISSAMGYGIGAAGRTNAAGNAGTVR